MNRRTLFALGVLAVAGCSDDNQHFPGGTPIFPGGGSSGSGSTSPDGGIQVSDASVGTIFGTVCQRTSVAPQACTPLTGQTGLLITDRDTDDTTTLAADGSFTLPGAPGHSSVTIVTATQNQIFYGGAVTTPLETNGGGRVTIPVMTQAFVDTLTATNSVGLGADSGFLVVHTGTGVTVTDDGATVLYDIGQEPMLSIAPPTDASGTAVVFNVSGAQTLSLVRDVTTVPSSAIVVAGAATFLEAPF